MNSYLLWGFIIFALGLNVWASFNLWRHNRRLRRADWDERRRRQKVWAATFLGQGRLVVINRDNVVVLIPITPEDVTQSRVAHYVMGRDGETYEVESLPLRPTSESFDDWECWGEDLLSGHRYCDGRDYPLKSNKR